MQKSNICYLKWITKQIHLFIVSIQHFNLLYHVYILSWHIKLCNLIQKCSQTDFPNKERAPRKNSSRCSWRSWTSVGILSCCWVSHKIVIGHSRRKGEEVRTFQVGSSLQFCLSLVNKKCYFCSQASGLHERWRCMGSRCWKMYQRISIYIKRITSWLFKSGSIRI